MIVFSLDKVIINIYIVFLLFFVSYINSLYYIWIINFDKLLHLVNNITNYKINGNKLIKPNFFYLRWKL